LEGGLRRWLGPGLPEGLTRGSVRPATRPDSGIHNLQSDDTWRYLDTKALLRTLLGSTTAFLNFGSTFSQSISSIASGASSSCSSSSSSSLSFSSCMSRLLGLEVLTGVSSESESESELPEDESYASAWAPRSEFSSHEPTFAEEGMPLSACSLRNGLEGGMVNDREV
jgi:hypothetical protein